MTRLYHIWTTIFILAFAVTILPGTVQADKMKGGQGAKEGMEMSQLSPEEKVVVQKLMQKYHDQMVEMHKKIFAKRAELNAVLAQEKFDPVEARALAKEISSMESDLMQKKLGMFIEMREKGVSYYGTCMVGSGMGACMLGPGMGVGSGVPSRSTMMGGSMMGAGQEESPQE